MQTMIVGALFPQPNQAGEAALFPKIRKSCRSFKEVAEVTISQLEYLLNRNYLAKPGSHANQTSTNRLHTQASDDNINQVQQLETQLFDREDQIAKLRNEVEFFKKQAEYSYKRTNGELNQQSEVEMLQNQLGEANEHLEGQYRSAQAQQDEMHAL